MSAMSDVEMVIRAAEQAEGMRQRGPLMNGQQEAMRNLWGGAADEGNNFVQTPTMWDRMGRWWA